MADRDETVRASLPALRTFGADVKSAGQDDLVTGLGNNFAVTMSQHVLGFMGTGTGSGTHPVAPMGEAVYFGHLMADYAQAAGRFAGDVVLGLVALGFAAEGIATQYSDGDALSSATIEQVSDAFVPQLGDSQPVAEATEEKPADSKKTAQDPTGYHAGTPERGERPPLPGGGPDVPDAESADYQNRPFQL
ncbi:hypothetical protein [Cryptosporangium arvum]|uniref:Uncharacterized protein n=1 Tax=Cryptosporangium arvum DSM 44712 TaxID=927661 RepID=A0A011ABA1_9ACTN|nr:hypothetical protein [Cryptosporangium arvum]EXG79261.1 hypothetical protein CryarDRAFT_0292 [Cryptosporangium arvum DSM 44712]